jgi:hypothetical protein
MEFFDYFAGASVGSALHLANVTPVEEISLQCLLLEFGWRPPVSWCRVPSKSKLGQYLRAR